MGFSIAAPTKTRNKQLRPTLTMKVMGLVVVSLISLVVLLLPTPISSAPAVAPSTDPVTKLAYTAVRALVKAYFGINMPRLNQNQTETRQQRTERYLKYPLHRMEAFHSFDHPSSNSIECM